MLSQDAAKGVSLGPILDKITSSKAFGKKGAIAVIEYPLLVAATSNFNEDNILGEGGLGCVYKAQFSDNFHAAVKRLHGKWQDSEREFEVNSNRQFLRILFDFIHFAFISIYCFRHWNCRMR